MNADRDRRRTRIERLIDVLWWRATRRQAACLDVSIRGLRVAGVDWMTTSELARLDRLQVALVGCQETTAEIQARVAAKRAARVAAMNKEV